MRSGTKSILVGFLLFLTVWLVIRWIFPFFMPFLLGFILALAAEPLVKLLCGPVRLPRSIGSGLGVAAAFGGLSVVLLGLVALLVQGLKGLGGILPDLEQTAVSGLELLEQWLLSLSDRAPLSLRGLLRQNILDLFSGGTAFLSKGAEYILGLAGGFLTHIPDRAFTLLTTVISGFMISAKLPKLRGWAKEKLSRQSFQTILSTLRRVRSAVGLWLLAQCKLAGVAFLILLAGLILLKIPYAPVWALGITVLDALPILGTGTVLLPWSLISLLQHDGARALGLLGLYAVVSLTRSMLEPRLVGKQLGLDPLITLAALYVGFRLWGFFGMILSPLLTVTAFQLISAPENRG